MNYYDSKAKIAYEKFQKGLPFEKVYAAVQKGDKFIVLKNNKGKYKYSLSGGGVDDGETAEQAIKRELMEELNIKVNINKNLGVCKYIRTWRYLDKEFDIDYVSHIFLTEFVSYGDYNKFGLDGEFDGKDMSIVEISKEEMIENVFEFKDGGIEL